MYDEEKESHWSIGSEGRLLSYGVYESFEEAKLVVFNLVQKVCDGCVPHVFLGDNESSDYYGATYGDWLLYIGNNGVILFLKGNDLKMCRIEGSSVYLCYKNYEEEAKCTIPRLMQLKFLELIMSQFCN